MSFRISPETDAAPRLDRMIDSGTGRRVVLLNNSRETFTPTVSGAIATCQWEMLQCVSEGEAERFVLTKSASAAPYDYEDVRFIEQRRPVFPQQVRRAVRRLTGWAHEDQHAYARSALRQVRRLAPDAVICNNDPEIAVYLSRRLPRVRVVHLFHNVELASDRWRRSYVRDGRIRTVAVSNYLARAVEQAYRMTPRSVRVARNGVDAYRFRPAVAEGKKLTVAFLGRVAVEKGTDTFLRAIRVLGKRGLELEVLLIGDTNWGFSDQGPYSREIAELVAELETLGVPVRRTGHVIRTELPRVLREADIQVMSSRWDEPCALTILEGMASGLAMVATATGGTPELVGEAGVLVPRESPRAMADAIERLLEDPMLRARFQQAARERALGFTWANTWAALEAAALDDGPWP